MKIWIDLDHTPHVPLPDLSRREFRLIVSKVKTPVIEELQSFMVEPSR